MLILSALLCLTIGNADHLPIRLADSIVVDPAMREALTPLHAYHTAAVEFPFTEIDSMIDVLTYEVSLDWSSILLTPRKERLPRKCNANARISLVVVSTHITTIDLHAVSLDIDAVRLNGAPAVFTLDEPGGRLRIQLPTAASKGDSVALDIDYGIMSDNRGFFAYSDSDMVATGQGHAIAFTFNQPERARTWFPCHDVPFDKALFTANVTVPKEFVVVSNGRRVARDSINASNVRETWRHELQMSTYLFVVNAGRFAVHKQEYVRSNGDTIHIENYQWPEDFDGPRYSVLRATQNIPKMFGALEQYFGEYPFASYGHVAIVPFEFGGMEHQSMSSVNRDWLRGVAELGYAHELGHQWFGDWVTCASWNDIWLNEGAATWSEALYNGRDGDTVGYRARMRQRRDRYMWQGLKEPPVFGISITNLFNEATTYCKAAWVYHMIRTNVGDARLFPLLRSFLQEYRESALQTSDFIRFWESNAPDVTVDWETFFDQWLIKAGHPVLYGTIDMPVAVVAGEPVDLRVRLRQDQTASNVPSVFVVPVLVRLLVDGVAYDTTVVMTERSVDVTMRVPGIPTAMMIDPNDDILCEKEVFYNPNSVAEIAPSQWCAVSGEIPARSRVTVRLEGSDPAQYVLCDIQGRVIRSGNIDVGFNVVDLSSLAQSVVFLNVNRNGKTVSFFIPVVNR